MFKITKYSATILIAIELVLITLVVLSQSGITSKLLGNIGTSLPLGLIVFSGTTLFLFLASTLYAVTQKQKFPKKTIFIVIASFLLWIPASITMTVFSY